MIKPRIEVQSILEELTNSDRVYFQPPESFKLKYPCVVYTLQTVERMHANDKPWLLFPEYLVNYISKDPDDPVIMKLMSARGFAFDRHYVSDNLHHNVFRYVNY